MPDPTGRWTERINFTKLSSDLHIHTCTCILMHIHNIEKDFTKKTCEQELHKTQ